MFAGFLLIADFYLFRYISILFPFLSFQTSQPLTDRPKAMTPAVETEEHIRSSVKILLIICAFAVFRILKMGQKSADRI